MDNFLSYCTCDLPPQLFIIDVRDNDPADGKQLKNDENTFVAPYANNSLKNGIKNHVLN